MSPRPSLTPLLCAVIGLVLSVPTHADDPAPLAFEITYDEAVVPGPVDARVYVMLGDPQSSVPPGRGPNWFNPAPFFAVDVEGWQPGEPLTIDASAVGFPGPLDRLEPGEYAIQAVIRLNKDSHTIAAPGSAISPVAVQSLDPASTGPVPLVVDTLVPPRPFPETERVKLVETRSDLLSEFYGREIRHRAAVILPEDDLEPGETRPTVYIIPGFGGDHFSALRIARDPRFAFGEDFVRVVLDPDCYTGHHVFADSATNGPRGQALVEEFIPYIEANFPATPDPDARFLNGHSSGGWSSLWLQVSYPESFGGTWSTSPDPVDFRDFQQINIYREDENAFVDRDGERRPVARRGEVPFLFYDSFSRMEEVIGDGGQLRSFEAVFSPLGPDGAARRLWDRDTGAIDPEVAEAWKAYDIRYILESNWDELGPKLEGKIHVWMGDLDTFYLEGATMLLKDALERLGSDAEVTIVPGADHGSLITAELAETIDEQMHEAAAIAK